MTQPLKFRYVNEIAGVFVLLCCGLFVAGILLTGRAQGWFHRYEPVLISFPAEGSSGLKKGAEVEMLGTVVGSVESISLTDSGDMQARLSVRSDFYRYVRMDSRILIQKKFFVAGDAYVEIERGKGEPLPDKDHVIRCEAGRELIETIQELADEVRGSGLITDLREMSREMRTAVLEVLNQAKETLVTFETLGRDMQDPEGRAQVLLARLDRLTARLEAGEGTAGRLMTDSALIDRIMEITDKADRSLDDVQVILDDVKKTTADLPDLSRSQEILDLLRAILEDVKKVTAYLPEMTAVASDEARDVPGMVLQIRESLIEVEELVAALKRHWLIRGAIDESPPETGRIPAGAVDPREGTGAGNR